MAYRFAEQGTADIQLHLHMERIALLFFFGPGVGGMNQGIIIRL